MCTVSYPLQIRIGCR